jgi:hypothetical protein
MGVASGEVGTARFHAQAAIATAPHLAMVAAELETSP